MKKSLDEVIKLLEKIKECKEAKDRGCKGDCSRCSCNVSGKEKNQIVTTVVRELLEVDE